MDFETTLKSIRRCLNSALEADDDYNVPISPFTPNNNNNNNNNNKKTHQTKCGYARQEGNTLWQIRYKPFGIMQTGILAGGDDDSRNARVLTSVVVAHFQSNSDVSDIPKTLVLFSLKCTELRHLLKEGRLNVRKGKTLVERIPTLSRLDGGTIIDIAPLLVPILGPVVASTADVVQLIDMAEACSYPQYFDGIICREWQVRPPSKIADRIKNSTKHKWLAAVSVMIRECLQPDLYTPSVTSPQLKMKQLGTLIWEQQSLWKQNQSTVNDCDQMVRPSQTGTAPPQPNQAQKQNQKEERSPIAVKQEMQPYQKGEQKEDEARQDPEITLLKRSKRERKSVIQFDATPWTMQQKAKIMKEMNWKATASPKIFVEINKVPQAETNENLHDMIKVMLNTPGPIARMCTRSSSRQDPLLERNFVRTSARFKNNSYVKYDENSKKGDDCSDERSAKRQLTNEPVLKVKKAPISQFVAVSVTSGHDDEISDKEVDDEESERSINVHVNQWQRLDFRGLVSDYKYHDFDPIDFGCSLESAIAAVDFQLKMLQNKNLHSVDDDIYFAETRSYAKSMKERRQKSDSERIEKEQNREEYEKRVMEYQYYGAKKRSAEDLELDAFLERPILFSARRESSRKLRCPIGSSCDYCSKPIDMAGPLTEAYVCSDILAPCVRLSDVKDAWRESTAGMNSEPVSKGKYKAPRVRRAGRNSNKSQHAFYMLSETKHSLIFIQRYNKGYLKK